MNNDYYNQNSWCVEYSKEQNQFHVQELRKRNHGNDNGYQLLGIYDTKEIAGEHLDIFYKASIEKPDIFKSLLETMDELEADILASRMALNIVLKNRIVRD